LKTWFFTEDAYPYLPDADTYESIRVNLPNRHYDPDIGADLYHRYLDMWNAADEIGLEIMLNEHHQTATCVVPAAPLMLAVLARETKRARLLILGNPIANRRLPTRLGRMLHHFRHQCFLSLLGFLAWRSKSFDSGALPTLVGCANVVSRMRSGVLASRCLG